MKTIPQAVMDHLRGDSTSIAICWLIEKKDETFIRGTEHDEDIVIAGTVDSFNDLPGMYPAGSNITGSTVASGSDMSPDNMQVDGALPVAPVDYIDVSVADIEAGLLDQAPVTVFFVNWQAPDDGQVIIRRGFLGEISRDSDGKYTTEVRGLLQLLSQVFVETYSERCMVKRFGDFRCKIDLAPFTHTGTVTAVTNRKSFATDISITSETDFRGGEFTFTTGANAGYMRESKSSAFTFWEAFPNDVEVGDEFIAIEACDRQMSTCRDRFNNIVNFRGFGVFIPGIDALSKGPT